MENKNKDYRSNILNKRYKRIYTIPKSFLNEIEVIEYVVNCELPIIHKKGAMCRSYFELNYQEIISKSTKRNWVEDKIDCRLVMWDTDLEAEEQDCIIYLLEYFNYEQGSFELEELREILAENTEEENMINACDILIKALVRNSKETIEIE